MPQPDFHTGIWMPVEGGAKNDCIAGAYLVAQVVAV
jgi:hypothetical protein